MKKKVSNKELPSAQTILFFFFKKSPRPQASVSNQRTITTQPGSMQTERNAASLQIQQRHPLPALVGLQLGKMEKGKGLTWYHKVQSQLWCFQTSKGKAACVSSAHSRLLRGGDNCHGGTLRLQISQQPGCNHRMITLALAISWAVFLRWVVIGIYSNTNWWKGSANVSPRVEHKVKQSLKPYGQVQPPILNTIRVSVALSR